MFIYTIEHTYEVDTVLERVLDRRLLDIYQRYFSQDDFMMLILRQSSVGRRDSVQMTFIDVVCIGRKESGVRMGRAHIAYDIHRSETINRPNLTRSLQYIFELMAC
jgi:hypothetical protein